MLDGIRFYPKKKKRVKFKIFMLLIILATVYGVWLLVENMGNNTSEQSTLIVISTPVIESDAIDIKVEKVEKILVQVKSDNNENLDEVIQTYEASSHD